MEIHRGNISNALTDNLAADIHVSQEVINTGTSLVFVGICIGDIPANIAIQWVSYSLLLNHPYKHLQLTFPSGWC